MGLRDRVEATRGPRHTGIDKILAKLEPNQCDELLALLEDTEVSGRVLANAINAEYGFNVTRDAVYGWRSRNVAQ